MITFINDKKNVITMGANGKKFVEEKYNWEDSVRIKVDNYEKI